MQVKVIERIYSSINFILNRFKQLSFIFGINILKLYKSVLNNVLGILNHVICT